MKNIETLYGYHAVCTVLQQRADDVLELILQLNRKDDRMNKIIALANKSHVKYQFVDKTTLEECAAGKNHQGFIAKAHPLKSWSEHDLLNFIETNTERCIFLVLDGVQDPHNLGACLRSANAFGVAAVIIPKDRAAPLTDVVRKVASGAAESTPLVCVTNLNRTLQALKKAGVWLIGLDSEAEQSIHEIDTRGNIAIVLGAEDEGLRRLTREACDYRAKIPMRGLVESLNVSVAAGVSLYAVLFNNNRPLA